VELRSTPYQSRSGEVFLLKKEELNARSKNVVSNLHIAKEVSGEVLLYQVLIYEAFSVTLYHGVIHRLPISENLKV
jgi:hypothetical protein